MTRLRVHPPVQRETPSYWLPGDRVTVLVRGDETSGSYAVVEAFAPPGGGPPLHRHRDADELIYVLDGEFELTVGETVARVQAGAYMHVPKGEVHCFRNVSPEPGRVLAVFMPAGFEQFFSEVGIPSTYADMDCPSMSPETVARIRARAEEFHMEFVLPPVVADVFP